MGFALNWKRDDNDGQFPKRLMIVGPTADPVALAAAVARGRTIGRYANLARSLANEPGNILTPAVFASRVETAASTASWSSTASVAMAAAR